MFKKDYFIERAEMFNISVMEYLTDAEFNYVIIQKYGSPLVFQDNTPVVYGGEEDAETDMIESDNAITELEFLVRYCRDEVEKAIADFIIKEGYNDEVSWIHSFDKSFDNVIDYDMFPYTDILSAYVGMEDKHLSFLCSSNNDKFQTWLFLTDFDEWVWFKILCDFV